MQIVSLMQEMPGTNQGKITRAGLIKNQAKTGEQKEKNNDASFKHKSGFPEIYST